MLENAFDYKDKLVSLFSKTAYQDKYKFYTMSSYASFEVNIKSNGWDVMQFVSVHNGEVIGYMHANIDRECYSVSSLALINFTNENIIFSKDIRTFFEELFGKFKFNKINWKVIVGNPAEKIYDKLIQKHGGRIVGTFRNDARLWDNELYDVKHYEILRSEYHLKSN